MKSRTLLTRLLATLVAVLAFTASAVAQTYTLNQTTLSAAVGATDTSVTIASASAATGSSFGAVAVGQILFVDEEGMQITSVASTTIGVQRRNNRTTPATTHASGATVFIGTGNAFQRADPATGVCAVGSQGDPWINLNNGRVWRCTASQWLNVVDAAVWVPASACIAAGSTATAQTLYGVAGTTGLGNIPTGASAIPVYQYASTAGTAHTYACQIPVPTRINGSRGSYLVDATFYYGVQQTLLPAQAATLASGFFNGVAVFTSITLPAAGASETPSTVTPVRADAGTLLITPVVASFNLALTTAGAWDSVKFTPATPIALTADITAFYLNVSFLVTTGVMTTNTPGFTVHYRTVTGL